MNLFKKLNTKDKHTSCAWCNYIGCNGSTWLNHATWFVEFYIGRTRKAFRAWVYNLGALDYSKIDDIELDGIDTGDCPDFCDAYISYATYKGKPMNEKQLDRLNADSGYVYECVIARLY